MLPFRCCYTAAMSPHSLLEQLVGLFPEFGPFWDDPGNCFREDDGAFNFYGVFAQLASFVPEGMTQSQRESLGTLVSECAASADEELSNAVCTNFIECVAWRAEGRMLKPHLTGAALEYFLLWDE